MASVIPNKAQQATVSIAQGLKTDSHPVSMMKARFFVFLLVVPAWALARISGRTCPGRHAAGNDLHKPTAQKDKEERFIPNNTCAGAK